MSRTVVLSATVVVALVAACMAAALVVAVVKPAEAAFPGRNGDIAFGGSQNNEGWGIYLMRPDGSNVRRLSEEGGSPSWSADGKKIAFSYNGTYVFGPDIYVMDANGANRRQLTNNSDNEYSPAWSPDGSKIAYVRDLPVRESEVLSKIYIMNVDGSNQVPLFDPATFSSEFSESFPAWSPDGKKIAFVGGGSGEYAGSHVYTVNPDGSGLTRLTRDGWYTKGHPDWSPDGSKIVFARYESGTGVPYDIIVMNSDGTGKKNITNSPAISEVDPTWSPDGRQIVYSRTPGGEEQFQSSEIWRMRANGTRRVQLTEKPALNPDWQPRP